MKLSIPSAVFCVILVVYACSSCHRQSAASTPSRRSEATIVNDNMSKRSEAESVEDLCARVAKIKWIPFDDRTGVDSNYDALIQAGDLVVPCLIVKIGDTTSMPDPRMAPRYAGIDNKVGDVALWVLERITKIDVLKLLPREVQADFKEEGVLAYFKYVKSVGHRKELQKRLYEWYKEEYGKDARSSHRSGL